jgi:ribokinase
MVVVFGSINLDLVAHVARMPAPGETLSGHSFSCLPGGKGANQALAASRAGAQVKMFGAVGRDTFAAPALANLEASGIDVAGVAAVDDATGVALIHVDAQGENAITVIAGANAHARAAQVPDTMLGPGATLVLQLEVPIAEVAALVNRAGGAHVIVNAAPATALPDTLLRRVGTLIVNESEAMVLGADLRLPATPDAFANSAAARYHCTVVVTLGAQGALAVRDSEAIVIAAPSVAVVDTTGAGDALVGAFAAALDRGAPLRQALAEGVAAGSLACAGHGAQAALPARDAIAALAATL